ncbi:MAG: mechanosensitive ion channel [Candidatus Omnitrophica bacterium]|nr:mechanosensitive ion channel [Candidatus Omnitrophota bacterium]
MAKKLIPSVLKKAFLPLLIVIITVISYLLYIAKFRTLLSENVDLYINKAFLTLIIISASFWLQRVSYATITWYTSIAAKTETRWDDEFIPLFKRVVNIIIWAVAVLLILSNCGVNINALIAALGVGSLAIALAAQDTIANIISGFLIMIDRPFRVGDKIKLPTGEKVEVIDIGVRRSKFLAEDTSIIIVPNLALSKSKIVNFTYGEEKR